MDLKSELDFCYVNFFCLKLFYRFNNFSVSLWSPVGAVIRNGREILFQVEVTISAL